MARSRDSVPLSAERCASAGSTAVRALRPAAIQSPYYDYVAFVNPDRARTFAPILDVFARQSNARLVGGRLQHPDGREQRGGRREFLTPWRAFVEVTRLDLLFPRHPYFRRFNMLAKSLMLEPTVVPVVSGAFMMMRRDYFQRIGGMDENFLPALR